MAKKNSAFTRTVLKYCKYIENAILVLHKHAMELFLKTLILSKQR